MADKANDPVVLELDPETMWALSEDRTSISLNMVVPAVAGLCEPLTISIDFDRESIDLIIERLADLRGQIA